MAKNTGEAREQGCGLAKTTGRRESYPVAKNANKACEQRWKLASVSGGRQSDSVAQNAGQADCKTRTPNDCSPIAINCLPKGFGQAAVVGSGSLVGLWVAQLSWATRISMYWLGLGIQITSIAIQICILTLLLRRNLLRSFPLFFSYVLYVLLRTIVGSITLSHSHVYFYFYWSTAPGEIILMILAAHESFRRVFRVFYLLSWVRILFPVAIVFALLYAALRGYLSPPVHASATGSAIISAMMTAQYVILTISIGFFALTRLLRVPWKIHEYRFMLGFGVSSVSIAFAASVRSEFGTRFQFLSGMLPALAYVLVLAIWLSAVAHPQPTGMELADQQLSPEELVNQLRRQLAMIRSLLRRG